MEEVAYDRCAAASFVTGVLDGALDEYTDALDGGAEAAFWVEPLYSVDEKPEVVSTSMSTSTWSETDVDVAYESTPLVESDFESYDYEDVLSIASHDSWDDDRHAQAAEYVNMAVMYARRSFEEGPHVSPSLVPQFESTSNQNVEEQQEDQQDFAEALRLQARQTLLQGLASGRLADAMSQARAEGKETQDEESDAEMLRATIRGAVLNGMANGQLDAAFKRVAEKRQQQQRKEEVERLRAQWSKSIGPKYRKVMEEQRLEAEKQQRQEEVQRLRLQWAQSIGPKYRKAVAEQQKQEEVEDLRGLVRTTLSKGISDGSLISALQAIRGESETLRADEEEEEWEEKACAIDLVDKEDSRIDFLAFDCMAEALDTAITRKAANVCSPEDNIDQPLLSDQTGEHKQMAKPNSDSSLSTARRVEDAPGNRQLQSSKSHRRIFSDILASRATESDVHQSAWTLPSTGIGSMKTGILASTSTTARSPIPWTGVVKKSTPSALMLDLGIEKCSRPPSSLASLAASKSGLHRSESAGGVKVVKLLGEKGMPTKATAAGSLAWSIRMTRKSQSFGSLPIANVVF
jgi:hypothetical protein